MHPSVCPTRGTRSARGRRELPASAYRLISSFSSLPGLKYGIFFAGTSTLSPVFGLRPMRAPRLRSRKEPNPRSSIFSPSLQRSDDRLEHRVDDGLGVLLGQVRRHQRHARPIPPSSSPASPRDLAEVPSAVHSATLSELRRPSCASASSWERRSSPSAAGTSAARSRLLGRGLRPERGLVERHAREADLHLRVLDAEDRRADGVAFLVVVLRLLAARRAGSRTRASAPRPRRARRTRRSSSCARPCPRRCRRRGASRRSRPSRWAELLDARATAAGSRRRCVSTASTSSPFFSTSDGCLIALASTTCRRCGPGRRCPLRSRRTRRSR